MTVPSGNSELARRRIAWHIQAEREGGLPESARQHALAIAKEASLRIHVRRGSAKSPLPHATVTGIMSDHDSRLPMPGSVLMKEHRGKTVSGPRARRRIRVRRPALRVAERYRQGDHRHKVERVRAFSVWRRRGAVAAEAKRSPPRPSRLAGAGPLCDLHPEVHGRRLGAGFQQSGCAAGSGRGLHSQPEAAGLERVAAAYDDGGFTGANMERPALKQLLADVQLGKLDCIVVYKIDRLTRSMRDFFKILEILEKHHVTFVSVTQQFNTATSIGRLALNMVMSFAEFERETDLRADTRQDARRPAQRASGSAVTCPWVTMLRRSGGALEVNPAEAEQVRESSGSIWSWARSFRSSRSWTAVTGA